MPVVDAVRSRAKAVTLSRPGTPVRSEGYAQPGAPVVDTIQAHIQVLSAQEVRDLPPGQNATDWRNIWSETEMKLNDQITDDKTYTIKRVEYWPEGEFYRAAAVITEDVLT